MRTFKIFILLFTLFGSTSFLFTNCGESLHLPDQRTPNQSEMASSSLDASVTASANPFENAKVQFNGKVALDAAGESPIADQLGKRTKSGQTFLPQGLQLIAVLYNNCAAPSPLYLKIKGESPQLNLDIQNYTWTLEEDTTLEQVQTLVSTDNCIRGISNDGLLSANSLNDPYYSMQNSLISTGHPKALGFFNNSLAGANRSVVVAVIDSGVEYNHPDLSSNILKDSTGKVVGYDYRNNDADPKDDFGHGTAVAGIIAASSNNNIGVSGVMGQNIKIMPLKVQDSAGLGYISDIVKAIDYAIAAKVDVINISMAGEASSTALLDAMQRAVAANIFVVVAAGNAAVEISPSKVIVPAFYSASISGAMSVGSIDSGTTTRSSFSNYSATYVEIFAPGKGGIYFPCLIGSSGCATSSSYSTGSGTSYAAPVVAGAAALTISFLKNQGVSYSAANIEALLMRTADAESSLQLVGKEGRSLSLDQLAHYLRTGYSQSTTGGYDDY